MAMSSQFLKRQKGLSLIEVLVGMALGLLLTAGILQLFFGTKSTYTAQDGISKIQESSRFAAEFLGTEMRIGGLRSLCYDYFGGDALQITNHLNVGGQLLYSANSGVWGWEYTGTADGDTYELPEDLDPSTEPLTNWAAADGVGQLPAELQGLVVPGSDVLLIKRITQAANWTAAASGGTATTIPIELLDATIPVNTDGSGMAQGDLTLVTNCRVGDLFVNTSAAANVLSSNGGVTLPADSVINALSNDAVALGAYGQSAQIYRYNSSLFYIGRRDDGSPPSLFKVNLGVGGVPQELVENVESMQVLFGITNNADVRDQVAAYVAADAVPAWDRVLTVRIGLLVRSPANADPGAVARSLDVNEVTIDVPADRMLRSVFVMDSTPRNLVRVYPY